MIDLKSKKLFLLDLDGTIYLDDILFDKVTDFIEEVVKRGGRIIYLTNNSSKSVSKYVEKMKRIGIEAREDDFVTSVDATIEYLKTKDYKKIYVEGTESFFSQLEASGLRVTSSLEEGIDSLVIGFDTELTFKKLEEASILLTKGVDFIAANPDWVCPTSFGFVPDCGSVCEMLTRATGRKPRFIGKPNPEMIYLAVEKAGYKKEETALVGDRLYTDIASANNARIDSILVLSGETRISDLENSEVKPSAIYKDIAEIYEEYIK